MSEAVKLKVEDIDSEKMRILVRDGNTGGNPSAYMNLELGEEQKGGGVDDANMKFGQAESNNGGGTGGGGYYAGGHWGAGGGGAGYIGGVDNGSTENGVQSGDGKATIMLIGE